ncbi:glycosyltransferase involved in cell wall biosynthesis [Ochrobactrum daejeonense]|uniref:Glycosyltransferase involved in cell wall biosynthesis n=2 Tax=Brucella daejeonensis TaxID=659015 RepID=A0A7W9EK05_9HYPH|nr:glycosyltransferase involved in cell wall biosynthesis [Brucella daejeonensis]
MGSLLMRAIEMSGNEIEIISHFRSFHRQQNDFLSLIKDAKIEKKTIIEKFKNGFLPDAWFSYHVYYKSPDLIGPSICRYLNIPYITAESSYAASRDRSGWDAEQRRVKIAIRMAQLNIHFTQRDLAGLRSVAPEAHYAALPPFIDAGIYWRTPAFNPTRLVTTAMMRKGDKLASYRMLADALSQINNRDWTLSIIGDGPERPGIEALFSHFPEKRIDWLGQKNKEEIAEILSEGGLYVWPGNGEAYGMAYLEAQAAGLPVIAQRTAGVPEVVINGRTGLLTPEGNTIAYADAIKYLLDNPGEASRLGRAARCFVHSERSLEETAKRMHGFLSTLKRPPR